MLFTAGMIIEYDRVKALAYSNRWALDRNPAYFNYDGFGGDCTNFISQCIYAGSGVMNYTTTYGWYYIDGSNKAPAWTGVPYLYNFLTRTVDSSGPFGQEVDVSSIEPGDIIQLKFHEGGTYAHSLFVSHSDMPASVGNILINTHTFDRHNYPLTMYSWHKIRFIKILGVRT